MCGDWDKFVLNDCLKGVYGNYVFERWIKNIIKRKNIVLKIIEE